MSKSALEKKPALLGGINSGLLRELHSIPVVETAAALVSNAQKESRVVRTGMALLEYGASSVSGLMFRGGLPIFNSIDLLAEKGLITLKEKYPTMTQTPQELQDTAYSTVRKTVRVAMKTPPGRVLLSGLDWALHKCTSTLKRLGTRHDSKHSDKGSLKVIAEHAYASEDSGAFEPEMKSTSKEPLAALSALTKQDSLLSKAYKLGIIYPIERLVATLRYVRWYAGGSKRTEKKSVTTGNLAARRTIKSPRKRVRTTLWTSIKNAALKILGANADGRLLGIYFRSASNAPVSPGNADRKRPHDEILTDDASDSEDSLADFDIDNYDSEEDPDYEPQEQDSGEDSDDMSSEGDPESDLEAESIEVCANGEFKTRKIRYKPQTKVEEAANEKGTASDSKGPKPVDKTSQDTKQSKPLKEDIKTTKGVPSPSSDTTTKGVPSPALDTATKGGPSPSLDTKNMSPNTKKGKNKKANKNQSPQGKANEMKGSSNCQGINPTVLLQDIGPAAKSSGETGV